MHHRLRGIRARETPRTFPREPEEPGSHGMEDSKRSGLLLERRRGLEQACAAAASRPLLALGASDAPELRPSRARWGQGLTDAGRAACSAVARLAASACSLLARLRPHREIRIPFTTGPAAGVTIAHVARFLPADGAQALSRVDRSAHAAIAGDTKLQHEVVTNDLHRRLAELSEARATLEAAEDDPEAGDEQSRLFAAVETAQRDIRLNAILSEIAEVKHKLGRPPP
jgi:hypothetical protein